MSEKFREVGKRKSTTSTDKFKCDRCYGIAAEFDSFLLRPSTLAQDRDSANRHSLSVRTNSMGNFGDAVGEIAKPFVHEETAQTYQGAHPANFSAVLIH